MFCLSASSRCCRGGLMARHAGRREIFQDLLSAYDTALLMAGHAACLAAGVSRRPAAAWTAHRHRGVAYRSAQLPHQLSQQCHEAVPIPFDYRCRPNAGRLCHPPRQRTRGSHGFRSLAKGARVLFRRVYCEDDSVALPGRGRSASSAAWFRLTSEPGLARGAQSPRARSSNRSPIEQGPEDCSEGCG